MRVRSALVAAGLVAALAGCSLLGTSEPSPPGSPISTTSPAPVPSDAPADLTPYYRQGIEWTGCGGSLECGSFLAPRDYADPAAGDFTIDAVRIRSNGDGRLGALVVNPGGPGGSGIDYAKGWGLIVSPDVLDAYDLVGFDPRGVGASDPVECLDTAQTDALIALDSTPDDAAEQQRLITGSALVGKGCSAKSPDTYRWMDTVSAARDMDILRASLGEEKLTLLGKSYGTLLGSVYAEQFPDRVGRFVLDGALPADLSAHEISRGQAAGFEQALHRFVADCLPRSACPLESDGVAGGVAEVDDFLAGLEAAPLPAAGGRELTEALGVTAVLYSLYFPPGDWAALREGLAAAFHGDGSVLLSNLDARMQRDRTAGYLTNAQEAYYAVTCLDRPATPLPQIEAQADEWTSVSPTFGPYLAWSDAVCAQWPVPPVSAPRVIEARGAAPILVVSTQYDPATPYDWGVRMRDQLADAALVSYNGDGHTAYRQGDECVDAVVDAYLLAGTMPAADPRCGY